MPSRGTPAVPLAIEVHLLGRGHLRHQLGGALLRRRGLRLLSDGPAQTHDTERDGPQPGRARDIRLPHWVATGLAALPGGCPGLAGTDLDPHPLRVPHCASRRTLERGLETTRAPRTLTPYPLGYSTSGTLSVVIEPGPKRFPFPAGFVV